MPSSWNGHIVKRTTESGEITEETLGGEGYATYRLKVLLKEEMDLGIKVPRQGTSYLLFCNGRKVYQSGRVGTNKESSMPDRSNYYVNIPLSKNELLLVVQIANFSDAEGGFWSTLVLGNYIFITQISNEI